MSSRTSRHRDAPASTRPTSRTPTKIRHNNDPEVLQRTPSRQNNRPTAQHKVSSYHLNDEDFDNGDESLDQYSTADLPNGDPEEEYDEFDDDELDDMLGLGQQTKGLSRVPMSSQQSSANTRHNAQNSHTMGRTTLSGASRPTLNGSRPTLSASRPTLSSVGNSFDHYQPNQDDTYINESSEMRKERLEVEKYFNNKTLLASLLSNHKQLQSQNEKLKIEKQSLQQSVENKETTLQNQLVSFEKSQSTYQNDLNSYRDQINSLKDSGEKSRETIMSLEAQVRTLETQVDLANKRTKMFQSGPMTRRKSAALKSIHDLSGGLEENDGDQFIDPTQTPQYQQLESSNTQLTKQNSTLSTQVDSLQSQLQTLQASYADLIGKRQEEQQLTSSESGSQVLAKYSEALKEKRQLQSTLKKYVDAFGELDADGNVPQKSSSSSAAVSSVDKRGNKGRPSTRQSTRAAAAAALLNSDDEDLDQDTTINFDQWSKVKTRADKAEGEVKSLKTELEKTKTDLSRQTDLVKRKAVENQQLGEDLDDLEAELNDKIAELTQLRGDWSKLNDVHSTHCKSIESEFQHLKTQTQIDVAELSSSNEKLEADLVKMKEENRTKLGQITELEIKVSNLTNLSSDRDSLSQQLTTMQSKIYDLEQQKGMMAIELEGARDNNTDMVSRIGQIEEEFRDREDELLAKNVDLGKQIKNLNESLVQLRDEFEITSNNENEKLVKRLEDMAKELSQERDEYRQLQLSASEQHTLLQTEFDAKNDEIRDLNRKYKKLQTSFQALKEQHQSSQTQQDELLVAQTLAETTNSDLIRSLKDDIAQREDEWKRKLSTIQSQYDELKSVFDENSQKFTSLKSTFAINIDKTHADLIETKAKLETKEGEYNALILRFSELERQAEILEAEHGMADKQRKQYLSSVNETQRIITKQQGEIEHLVGEMKQQDVLIDEYKTQLDAANSEMVAANDFVNELEQKYSSSKQMTLKLHTKYKQLKEEQALLQNNYDSLARDNADLQQQISHLISTKNVAKPAISHSASSALNEQTQSFSSTLAMNTTREATVPQSVIKQRRQEKISSQASVPQPTSTSSLLSDDFDTYPTSSAIQTRLQQPPTPQSKIRPQVGGFDRYTNSNQPSSASASASIAPPSVSSTSRQLTDRQQSTSFVPTQQPISAIQRSSRHPQTTAPTTTSGSSRETRNVIDISDDPPVRTTRRTGLSRHIQLDD